MSGFSDLGINQTISLALESQGLVQPTPIQERAIPIVLAGRDIIAQAQTGTGKTLAFVLPMLQRTDTTVPSTQGLIIAPTRELALQITTEVKKITEHMPVQVLTVYGGQDVERQIKKLQGAVHMVVGTPGRLLDHIRRGTLRLSDVSMLVLDEADQMLHMGFLPEVEDIIRETPPSRQTMLFSATMPNQVRSLAKRYTRTPQDVKIQSTRVTLEDIRQIVVETTDRKKQDTLRSLIDAHRPYQAIIFCRTKRRAMALNEALQTHGYDADELHGELSQAKREQVMRRFREGNVQLLVATDVAARGLDVGGVTHVFNYDIPHDVESYIHRIGRTGRAGEQGLAITLVAPKDRVFLAQIEKGIHMAIDVQVMEQRTVERRAGGQTRDVAGDQRSRSEQRNTRHGKTTQAKGKPPQAGRGGRGRAGARANPAAGPQKRQSRRTRSRPR